MTTSSGHRVVGEPAGGSPVRGPAEPDPAPGGHGSRPDDREAIVRTRAALRTALDASSGASVGLVPTMGALHQGHLSLIRRAAAENEAVVVSVFVNPAQFNDPTDLATYPRDLTRDAALAFGAGATLIYAPAIEEIYPAGFATTVHVRGITGRWEGASRPGHFDGVATVVSILQNQVRPDRAYFGEKDFQQLTMIRRMHADLALPGEIVACPIVREPDGLALSSRNARLDAESRQHALSLSRALRAMRDQVAAGERNVGRLREMGERILRDVALDYLAIVDPGTLQPLETLEPGARALVAATVGGVRLIDTMQLMGDPMATDDGMVMTVLEAQVASEHWDDLKRAFATGGSGGLPPQMIQTMLVQDTADPTRWRGISLWRSRADLDAYRRSVETPGGVLMFRAAGAEPALSIFTVADHYAHAT